MSETELAILQSFCDSVPLGICLVDLQGKIRYWNAATESITGYLGHEVLGRAYRGDLLIHNSVTTHALEMQCPINEVLRDGRSVEADLYLRHKLGHRIPVHVYAFPLRDSMGEVVGVGEVLNPGEIAQESPAWLGHSDREFELATGLAATQESRERVKALLRSRSATTSAVILIELTELNALLKHGGAGMLHQAIRMLAKTVAKLLPPRNHVGCWTDWRLIALVQECTAEMLADARISLAGVGSSCAVKWWGDRVEMGIRSAATYGDPSKDVDQLIGGLEQELSKASEGKCEPCSSS
jgi:PAS domain S-box-containing protein